MKCAVNSHALVVGTLNESLGDSELNTPPVHSRSQAKPSWSMVMTWVAQERMRFRSFMTGVCGFRKGFHLRYVLSVALGALPAITPATPQMQRPARLRCECAGRTATGF